MKIESDYMPQPVGQLATRLEAFAESLFPNAPNRRKKSVETEGLYAGIDSGSTTTNMVVINEKKEILASATVRTGAKAQNGAKAALDSVCEQLGCRLEDFAAILATGYGRNNIPFATGTKKDLTISSMCTVFAESEVISLIADNHTQHFTGQRMVFSKQQHPFGTDILPQQTSMNKGLARLLRVRSGTAPNTMEGPNREILHLTQPV